MTILDLVLIAHFNPVYIVVGKIQPLIDFWYSIS